jgi:hypothetical protein
MSHVHVGFGVAETLPVQSRYSHAFSGALEGEVLQARVPAAFAEAPSEHLRSTYTFIPTAKVISALQDVGFLAVEARQARSRKRSPVHARHLLRLRRRFETVDLGDAIPELVLLNSHDGTSAYQLRVGLYRPVCCNGLMVAMGTFAALYVPHRGDVLERVVVGALEMSERFGDLQGIVARMRQTVLSTEQLDEFLRRALALRYGAAVPAGLAVERLLSPKREEDIGDDVWVVYNTVQEWLMRGGVPRKTESGRRSVTRGVRAIREDVRLNVGLWEIASSYVAAA